jgi:DNA-binding transcriptional ArsR family regulator
MVALLSGKAIGVHDERAKELAQILTSDKALAILHLIEDQALSISEIARELDIPISTVSYHMERMLRVGLVEVAGRKYGKRLQEVKLYRASNKPILLLPRKSAANVKKTLFPGFEGLHIISLALAGLVSVAVYAASKRLLAVHPESGAGNISSSPQKMAPLVETASHQSTSTVTASPTVPLLLAVITFVLTFSLFLYILHRRT